MTVGNGVDTLAPVLRRVPCSMVGVEVGAVLLDSAQEGVLAQLVYDRVVSPHVHTTLVAVHHTTRELPVPAVYERVYPGAPMLDPSEIGGALPRGRGLRWVAPADPGARAWSAGGRLVRLVDGVAAARLLAAHFAVPLHRRRPTA